MVDVFFNYVLNTIQVQSIIMVNFNHSGFVFLGGIPHQYVTLFVRLFVGPSQVFVTIKLVCPPPLTPKFWELPCENCLSPPWAQNICFNICSLEHCHNHYWLILMVLTPSKCFEFCFSGIESLWSFLVTLTLQILREKIFDPKGMMT